MPFESAAKAKVRELPAGDPTRVVLQFLLRHAVGVQNAKPWAIIETYLRARGIHITRGQFQQTILKRTRQNDIFIGSTDHGPSPGYFLIRKRDDAQVMQDFYTRRIAAEKSNLTKLKQLISTEWPS
jgi:hypothetical protein